MTDSVTLDFETFYGTGFSLSTMSNEAYIRDHRFEEILVGVKVNDERPYWVDQSDIDRAMKDLNLERKNVLCHHAQFDGLILSHRHGIHPGMLLDTMSMGRPVTLNTCGVSLAKLSEKFLLGEKGKEVLNAKDKRREDFTYHEIQQYAKYCMNDCELTYQLYRVLRQFSTPQEQYIIDMVCRMYTDPVIELDRTTLLEHLNTVQAEKARLLAKVTEFCGKEGIMSNEKFAEVLRRLDIDPPMKLSLAKTNNPKTNPTGEPVFTYAFSKTDETFKALLEHEDPRVQAVVAARLGVKSTIEETRAQAFIDIGERGPLGLYYLYWGAHTGRASGGDKVNLQNLPRGGNLRKALVPPPGHIIAACDSAQIEARIVAWWAGQTDLVDDFASGIDIYSSFASDIYGRTIDRSRVEIVNGEETFPEFKEGFVAKTAVLGLGFGMGPPKFEAQLKKEKIPGGLEFAEKVVRMYRTKYSRIPELWKQCQEAMEEVVRGRIAYIGVGVSLKWDGDGIHLPNGMLIRYPELQAQTKDGKLEYVYKTRKGFTKLYGGKIVENVVQALARIVVFNQMARIDQKLRKLDNRASGMRYRLVGTTHDEALAVCPEPWKEELISLMTTEMRRVPKWAEGLPINCKGGYGANYGECK